MAEQPLLFKNQLVAAVVQAADGDKGVPTGSDAVFFSELSITPVAVKTEDIKEFSNHMGGGMTIVVGKNVPFEGTFPLACGGVDGVPIVSTKPNGTAFIEACGFQATTGTALSEIAQGGTANTIRLHAGASAVDDAYQGHYVLVASASGTCQVSTDKTKIVLAAARDVEYSGALASGSTDTVLKLPATGTLAEAVSGARPAEDGALVGNKVKIGSETRTITAYIAASGNTTVDTAFGSVPAESTAFTVFHADNYHAGDVIQTKKFNGTLGNLGTSPTAKKLRLAVSVVGATTLNGMLLNVVHSGATQARTITSWKKINDDVVEVGFSAFSFVPDVGDVYRVGELRKIASSVGSTHICTLDKALKYATDTTDTYEISAVRVITNYAGATTAATVDKAFANAPKSGTAFTIPAYVKYTLKSSDFVSLTAYAYLSRVLQQAFDMKGTLSLAFKAGAVPKCMVKMLGLFDSFENATMPSATISGVEAIPVNAQNTSLLIHDYECIASEFSVDLNNTYTHQDNIGNESILIAERDVKFSATIRMPTPDVKDFTANTLANVKGNIVLQHGEIGNSFVIVAPAANITDVGKPTEQDGITMLPLSGRCRPQGDGNNEITLIQQ